MPITKMAAFLDMVCTDVNSHVLNSEKKSQDVLSKSNKAYWTVGKWHAEFWEEKPAEFQEKLLNSNKNLLNSKKNLLNSNKNVLNSKENLLNSNKNLLNSKKNLLNSNKNVLNSKENLLNSNKNLLNSKKNLLNSKKNLLNSKKNLLNSNKCVGLSQQDESEFRTQLLCYKVRRLSIYWVITLTCTLTSPAGGTKDLGQMDSYLPTFT